MCLLINFAAVRRKILVWAQSQGTALGLNEIRTIFPGGVTVDVNTWSGNLDDYSLICFPFALFDPPWWGPIAAGTWEGRLFITSDHWGQGLSNPEEFDQSAAYVNSKSGLSGISLIADGLAGGNGFPGPVETDDLTAGVTNIWHVGTSRVSGGTTIARVRPVDGSHPFVARNKVGTIDWVVAGDSNILYDRESPANQWGALLNSVFFNNMYDVDI